MFGCQAAPGNQVINSLICDFLSNRWWQLSGCRASGWHAPQRRGRRHKHAAMDFMLIRFHRKSMPPIRRVYYFTYYSSSVSVGREPRRRRGAPDTLTYLCGVRNPFLTQSGQESPAGSGAARAECHSGLDPESKKAPTFFKTSKEIMKILE
jgi:hypothetical protein